MTETSEAIKPITGAPLTQVVSPEVEDVSVRYDMPWLTSVMRPLLIAILTACLTIGLMAFLRYAIRGIPLLFTSTIVTLTIIATILGCVSTTLLAQPGQWTKRNTGLRFAELGLLLAIVRLTVWVSVGNWPSFNLFITRPMDALLDGAFIMALVVVGLAWGMAGAITSDFLKMSLQPDEIYAAQQRTGRSGDDPTPPNYTDRRGVLSGFVNKWMMGGVLMVLLSAGTQLEPSENGFFALGRQNIDPVVITATVLYFLTGLILISQGQFAVLRARWTLEKVPSAHSILRNWPVYATIMIVGIGILATLLPFGGTFYFYQILTTILTVIYAFMAGIVQLIFSLLAAFLSLFMGEPAEEIEQPPIEIAPLQLPEPVEEPAGAPPWLGGTIFWIILALLLGYAAYIYLSGRGVNFAWLRRFWQLLTMRLRELFGAYDQWRVKRGIKTKSDEKRGEGTLVADNWINRLRLRNLNPEQQIKYFYMTLLHQAKEAEIGRNNAETPLQYAPRLVEALNPPAPPPTETDDESSPAGDQTGKPTNAAEFAEVTELAEARLRRDADRSESREQIRSLTDAFLRIRYAGDAADVDQIPPLKQMWEAMKKRIQRVSK